MKIWSGLWKKIVAVFATITCVASLSSIATSYSITSSVDKNNFDIQTTKRENVTVDSPENKVEEKTNASSQSNNENQTNSVSNKTPSLRNITETAPYFHNGQIWSLAEAVKEMGSVQLGIEISDKEASKIVTFLKSLTGEKPAIVYPQLPESNDKTPKPSFD